MLSKDDLAPIKQYIVDNFLIPPGIVRIGGMPSSGKTTLARLLTDRMPGFGCVSSNMARFLLQRGGLSCGENVHQVVMEMLDRCVPCWNGVIIDGMFGAEKERDLISAFAARNNFPVFTVFVAIDPSLAMQRARAKYPDHVVSTFRHWRPNNVKGYFENIPRLHTKLAAYLEGHQGEVDAMSSNNSDRRELEHQAHRIVHHLREEFNLYYARHSLPR